MKRLILYFASAVIGTCLGILLHTSFMLIEAEGVFMLPVIEPGDKVLVSLIDENISKGDIVAFYAPYYTLEGEGNILFRRVRRVDEDGVILGCDTDLTREEEIILAKEDLLGKALLLEN